MTKPLARLAPIGVAALILLLPEPAPGGPATDELRTHISRVLKVLEDPQARTEARAAQRQAEIRRIAADIFDFTEMTRRSLGPHWQARSAAEREEIVQLFTGLLERAYMSKIETYSGERIVWAGETADGDQAVVRTRIVSRQGTEIPIDYRMLRRGEHWLTYDVTIEGVSLVSNYRTQFNQIIQRASYAELVKRLQTKLAERTESEPAAKRASQR
jgi:phospholipid transport system substrate-binding protein